MQIIYSYIWLSIPIEYEYYVDFMRSLFTLNIIFTIIQILDISEISTTFSFEAFTLS